MDSESKLTVAIFALPFAVFVAVLCIFPVTFIISKITGWDRLGREYPVKFSYSGTWQNWRSGQISSAPFNLPININRAISIGYTPAFLYLKVGFGLQIFMHDLQIPWAKVESYSYIRSWQRDMVKLNLPGGTFISLQKKDIEPALHFIQAAKH